MEKLLMGVAKIDITPSEPIETVGFGRIDEMSRGILHKLSAQVTVWKFGEDYGCIAAVDHIGFSKEHANTLRDEIGQMMSVDREKVMLCFSHGHSSPNESTTPSYYHFVCIQIKRAAVQASLSMVPVKAAWGNALTDIGLNRRKNCYVLDRRIGILKVCDAKSGELKLLLLRLTAHCNVLKADNYLISSDYFGTVRNVLGEKYDCPVIVIQGSAGNVAPKYFKSETNPPDASDERFIRTDKALDKMAQVVLLDAMPVIESLCPKDVNCFSMYSREINLIADVPSYEKALEVAAEAKKFCNIDGSGWLKEVQHLNEKNVTEQTDKTEVQYFVLGEGCLCGVANEVMVEFALNTASMLHDNFFYFNGYTNGCTGYFPTEEEFDQGGYEVYWSMLIYYMYHGRVFPLRRNSASQLIQFVVENYKR